MRPVEHESIMLNQANFHAQEGQCGTISVKMPCQKGHFDQ